MCAIPTGHEASFGSSLGTEQLKARPLSSKTPTLMEYADIPSVMHTLDEAFANDPFHRYLRDTPDCQNVPTYHTARHTEYYIWWSYFIATSVAWTIGCGASVVAYSPAKSTYSPRDNAAYLSMAIAASGGARLGLTKEQTKRDEEFIKKYLKAVHDALGDRENEVITLRTVATSPAQQGHGYASTLVRTVTDIADAQGRATSLISSNPINTPFYESLGFVERAQVSLGNDNPTWQEPPVVMLVMVREPVEST